MKNFTLCFLLTLFIFSPTILKAQSCPANITQNIAPGTCGTIVNYNIQTGSSGVHILNFNQSFFDYADNEYKIQISPFGNSQTPLIFSPTNGNKMAVFLQNCGATHYIYQDITLPSSGSIPLEFDLLYNNLVNPFTLTQYFEVAIRNPATNAVLQTVFITNPSDPSSIPMTHYNFDLSAFAGQLIRLEFYASFTSNVCNVYLDNVTLPGSTLTNGSFENNYTGWTLFTGNGCGTWGIGSGLSNNLTQTGGLATGSTFPVGITTNTFISSDAGNPFTCSFIVTVIDNENPTITCPGPVLVNAQNGTCGETVNYTVSATDNCTDGLALMQTSGMASGDIFPIGVTTNNFLVTDASGNTATCSFTVTVTDTQNPVITCPGDINVYTMQNICGATVNYTVTSSDNCTAGLMLTQTAGKASGGQFPVGTTTNIFKAIDASGNSATCAFRVIVADNEKPVLIGLPGNTTVQCNAVPAAANVTATNNCSVVSVVTFSESRNNGNCAGNYTLTRTWSAIDAHNNVTSASQIITVLDNIKPVFTLCPTNITATTCNKVTYNVTATDNCSTPSLSYTFSGATSKSGIGTGSGNSFAAGLTTVTIAATDACGNTNTCSFNITSLLGNLNNYLMLFTNGSLDANWQSATKGFAGNVAVNGIIAKEKTSGTIPFAGTLSTNDNTLSVWQNIINANPSQATAVLNQTALLTGLGNELESAFAQINAMPVTLGYDNRSATSLNGINTTDGIGKLYVINVTSGFQVSTLINITGDANDIFVLRWDTDKNFTNGYNGQVKFQKGGAIVPLGGLKANNFIHVAGDINASGGGSNPPAPYPQGPRTNNGTGSLITGGSNFSGGGFFTGYWLTTGVPTEFKAGQQPCGVTVSPTSGVTGDLSNAIFVGGWYSKTTKFSMTSGTSGVYVGSCPATPPSMAARGELITEAAIKEPFMVTASPNPSYNDFMLHISSERSEPVLIRIIDISGRIVSTTKLNGNETNTLIGRHLLSGIYFTEVIQGKSRKILKLVKLNN